MTDSTRTLRATRPRATCWPSCPSLLGFHPEDSVVLLTVGDARQPVPRPRRPARRPAGVELELAATSRRWPSATAPTRVAVAASTPTTPALAEAVADALLPDRLGRGRRRAASARCAPTGERWWPSTARPRRRPGHAVRRARATRWTAQAVLDGTVVLAQPARARATRWSATTPTRPSGSPARRRGRGRLRTRRSALAPPARGAPGARGPLGAGAGCGRYLADGDRLDDADVARLAVAAGRVARGPRRRLGGDDPRQRAAGTSSCGATLVRRVPAELRAAPAALLALRGLAGRRRRAGLVRRRPRARRPTRTTGWPAWSPRRWPARCRPSAVDSRSRRDGARRCSRLTGRA